MEIESAEEEIAGKIIKSVQIHKQVPVELVDDLSKRIVNLPVGAITDIAGVSMYWKDSNTCLIYLFTNSLLKVANSKPSFVLLGVRTLFHEVGHIALKVSGIPDKTCRYSPVMDELIAYWFEALYFEEPELHPKIRTHLLMFFTEDQISDCIEESLSFAKGLYYMYKGVINRLRLWIEQELTIRWEEINVTI